MEKLHHSRVMQAFRKSLYRLSLPSMPSIGNGEEVALPNDEGKVSNVEEVHNEMKVKTDRCSGTDCKKKIGITGFACRCRLFFCPLHRYSDKHNCTFDYKALGKYEIAAANPIIAPEKIAKI